MRKVFEIKAGEIPAHVKTIDDLRRWREEEDARMIAELQKALEEYFEGAREQAFRDAMGETKH